jgi:NAD(P)-dependent dehydrogenase (short-subunit alcohol dehydrogenase family)
MNLTTFNKYQLALEKNVELPETLGAELDEILLVNVRSFVHFVSLAFPFLKAAKKPSSITMILSNLFDKPDPKRTI